MEDRAFTAYHAIGTRLRWRRNDSTGWARSPIADGQEPDRRWTGQDHGPHLRVKKLSAPGLEPWRDNRRVNEAPRDGLEFGRRSPSGCDGIPYLGRQL